MRIVLMGTIKGKVLFAPDAGNLEKRALVSVLKASKKGLIHNGTLSCQKAGRHGYSLVNGRTLVNVECFTTSLIKTRRSDPWWEAPIGLSRTPIADTSTVV